MTGTNGTNGKHQESGRVLMKMNVGETTKSIQCPLRIQAKQCTYYLTVSVNDHCLNSTGLKCDNGHSVTVWHSHENDTYVVRSI